MKKLGGIVGIGVALFALAASAQVALQQDKPIEISSDTPDVLQNEHKAVFSGNVIAVQGTTNMRATKMVVFYRNSGGDEQAGSPQGIYRIEAEGNVVFTTPTEAALSDKAIYNVDTDTIDLLGGNVTLTRGQNILKGNHLVYNMATGRSVLTGGTGATASGKPARVHGLFVPKSSQPQAKP